MPFSDKIKNIVTKLIPEKHWSMETVEHGQLPGEDSVTFNIQRRSEVSDQPFGDFKIREYTVFEGILTKKQQEIEQKEDDDHGG